MRKLKPLIVEELVFAALFVVFYIFILDEVVDTAKVVAMLIAFEAAVFCSYQLCWYRLRVCRVTRVTRLTDGLIYLALVAIFAVAVRCLAYFGFEPLSLTSTIWLCSRYALGMLLNHILIISVMAPESHSRAHPFDMEDNDDDDISI